MWNVEVILGLYLLCVMPAFIFHSLMSLSKYIHCNLMHWVQWLYYCWKHLDKFCVLILASAACDHFVILNFSQSRQLELQKRSTSLVGTQLFLKSVHVHMILLLLISSLHSQILCQIVEAWSNSRFPPILQVPVSYTYVFKNIGLDLWHILFFSAHGWTF